MTTLYRVARACRWSRLMCCVPSRLRRSRMLHVVHGTTAVARTCSQRILTPASVLAPFPWRSSLVRWCTSLARSVSHHALGYDKHQGHHSRERMHHSRACRYCSPHSRSCCSSSVSPQRGGDRRKSPLSLRIAVAPPPWDPLLSVSEDLPPTVATEDPPSIDGMIRVVFYVVQYP